MIKSLKLGNVQKHVSLKLNFHPRVNYIVGRTDSGKSAIFRGLRWVLCNRPTNTSILRRGTKSSVAEVVIGKHTIARKRTKSKNTYVVDGDVKAGFGRDVPKEVLDITRMSESLHLQKQSDSYFLLGIPSASERAREIQKYTDLAIISESISRARGTVGKLKGRVDALSKMKEEAQERLKSLEPVKSLEALNQTVQALGVSVKVKTREIRMLETKRDIILALHSKERKLAGLASADVKSCREELFELQTEEAGLKELFRVSVRLKAIDLCIFGRGHIEKVEDTESISKRLQELEKLDAETSQLQICNTRLFINMRNQAKNLNTQRKLERIIAEIGVCPTCKRKL
jgi:exonuclease SbcC